MENRLDSLSFNSYDPVKGEDPWDELLQSRSLSRSLSGQEVGSGSIQPLFFPAEASSRSVYRWIRSVWAQETQTPVPLRIPLLQSFEPSRAIAFLLAQKWGCPTPPLSLRTYPSGATLFHSALSPENQLPRIPELCQLALLWLIANEREAACALIRWILPFIEDRPFFSLWCPEKEYDEKECLLSASLVLRFAGRKEKSAEYLAKVPKPFDPFFLALAKQLPRIDFFPERTDTCLDPDLGLKLYRNKKIASVFTLTGWESSLGVIQAGDVEIRAMGPQTVPLAYAKDFGISRIPDGTPLNDWTRLTALPEVWIEMKSAAGESDCKLDLRIIGVKPQNPLAMVFYAKAQSCQIGNNIYKPKSLSRFNGEIQSLIVKGKEGELKIESSLSHKVQVIPLAGEGCFWDSEFLIAFEIHPFAASASFCFSSM
jgi:hypothetical protein